MCGEWGGGGSLHRQRQAEKGSGEVGLGPAGLSELTCKLDNLAHVFDTKTSLISSSRGGVCFVSRSGRPRALRE